MIEFRKMSNNGFNKYVDELVFKIADEYTISGYCKKEDSIKLAKDIINQYIPNGLNTQGQYIYDIFNKSNENVGLIWYGKTGEDEAFICDFLIYEKYRNQGYGKKAMQLLENDAKEKGINKITLHVFGHNKTAITLYEKLGYVAFSMHMGKNI